MILDLFLNMIYYWIY